MTKKSCCHIIDDLRKIQPTYTHKKHATGPFFKVINYYMVKYDEIEQLAHVLKQPKFGVLAL